VLRFEEALARIVALGSPVLLAEAVPIEDADGRVLAEDLVARSDLPAFDYSSMDGYALRIEDLAHDDEPSRLPVRGESRTGGMPPPLATGTTMRIFTGAQIPTGADAVVMQEKVTREGDVATFLARPPAGQHVRKRGADIRAGSVALDKGTRLRPSHLSLAAALDLSEVLVVKRPEVAILATGDELRRPGTSGGPGSIPESNTVVLRAMARRAGAMARALPYVPDDRSATERAFRAALEESDVVVTVGGVSVGDHDLVRPALEAVGVSLDFWRVAIKPGKPLAVGLYRFANGRRDAIVLGLPGNPSSAMVTFALFGIPLLRAMQGDPRPFPTTRRARLTHRVAHEPGRTEFARAVLDSARPDEPSVTTVANQASGAVTSMAESNALVVIPAESNDLPEGSLVDVLLLDELCA
jgi:molybdopterin molybdotransferase